MSFGIASKDIKYLGMNLMNVRLVHKKQQNILSEVKENSYRWKKISYGIDDSLL